MWMRKRIVTWLLALLAVAFMGAANLLMLSGCQRQEEKAAEGYYEGPMRPKSQRGGQGGVSQGQ